MPGAIASGLLRLAQRRPERRTRSRDLPRRATSRDADPVVAPGGLAPAAGESLEEPRDTRDRAAGLRSQDRGRSYGKYSIGDAVVDSHKTSDSR